MRLSKDAKAALAWLVNRGGEGQFVGDELYAQGVVAEVSRKAWQELVTKGVLERFEDRRLRLTIDGRKIYERRRDQPAEAGSRGVNLPGRF